MTDLETMELVLRRALADAVSERIQDLAVIKTLQLLIRELTDILIERSRHITQEDNND